MIGSQDHQGVPRKTVHLLEINLPFGYTPPKFLLEITNTEIGSHLLTRQEKDGNYAHQNPDYLSFIHHPMIICPIINNQKEIHESKKRDNKLITVIYCSMLCQAP